MERGSQPWVASGWGQGQHYSGVEVETSYDEQAGPGGLQPVLSAGQCAPQWTWWGAGSGSSGFKLSSTVRVRPRPGAYAMSGYLQSSDVSTRGHSRGMGPC